MQRGVTVSNELDLGCIILLADVSLAGHTHFLFPQEVGVACKTKLRLSMMCVGLALGHKHPRDKQYRCGCAWLAKGLADHLHSSVLRRDHIIYKNKNIFKKMSEYVGFSPPPTYFLHIRCDQ